MMQMEKIKSRMTNMLVILPNNNAFLMRFKALSTAIYREIFVQV